MLNNLFIAFIYLVVLVLLFCLIKTVYCSVSNQKMHRKICFQLQEGLIQAQNKLQTNNEKIQILEDLQTTLFNRFFKITREIILMQKLIFEIHIK